MDDKKRGKRQERAKMRKQTSPQGQPVGGAASGTPQQNSVKQGKLPKRYYLRDAEAFTISFYERFDETFVYNQAVTLKYAIDQGESFRGAMNLHLVQLGLEPVSDKYFESLRAQLFFMVLHQCEALFALLLAPFSAVPDWIYLTTYRNDEIQEAVSKFLKGNIGALTNGQTTVAREFLVRAVYDGLQPSSADHRAVFDANLERIEWLLTRLAATYEENLKAYNSYKHGLRVMTGQTWFRLRPNDAQGNPFGHGLERASPDSLIFLELEQKPGDKATTVYQTIAHFDPEESFFYLTALTVVLETIKLCRLGRLKNQVPQQGLRVFTELNIDELNAKWAQRHFRWSVSQ